MAVSRWSIHCDGSALPRYGNMALGAVLQSSDGDRLFLSQSTGRRGCNNEAECAALIVALEKALELGARQVEVSCDSSMLVDETMGTVRTRVSRLQPGFDRARALLAKFESASVRWVPARKNREADALARAAQGLPPRPHQ